MTDDDISNENVKCLAEMLKVVQPYASNTLIALLSERDALSAAMQKSKAETAAVIDRAAQTLEAVANEWSCGHSARHCDCDRDVEQWGYAADEVRALKTPDQTAALDAVKAKAEADGMRKAAGIARDHTPEKHSGATLSSHVTGRSIEAAIIAAIQKGGAE